MILAVIEPFFFLFLYEYGNSLDAFKTVPMNQRLRTSRGMQNASLPSHRKQNPPQAQATSSHFRVSPAMVLYFTSDGIGKFYYIFYYCLR